MATKKKAAPARSSATRKSPGKTKTAPVKTSREHKAAAAALTLVDEAAELIRAGIKAGADGSEKARIQAKKRAHTLLNRAASSLETALGAGTSALGKLINKI